MFHSNSFFEKAEALPDNIFDHSMLGSSGGLWFTVFLLLGCWLLLLVTAAMLSRPGAWPGNFSAAKPNPGGGGGLATKRDEWKWKLNHQNKITYKNADSMWNLTWLFVNP